MKTKYGKETLQVFKKMTSREYTPEKFWVDRSRIWENFQNFLQGERP